MSDAAKAPRERPMSPHLSVWRWHITMATSIAHRATGVALYLGALIAAAWAIALAKGPTDYARFKALLASPIGPPGVEAHCMITCTRVLSSCSVNVTLPVVLMSPPREFQPIARFGSS